MNLSNAGKLYESEPKIIAKNLRLLFDNKQLTESEVANALNIPVMTIRRLISGETTDPRISTLKLIADFLDVSIDSLIQDHYSNAIQILNRSSPQFIPVLDWHTMVNAKSIYDIDFSIWKEWYPIVLDNQILLSKDAFGLESRPSMQPRFPLGTLFVIDPKEKPTDGDIILIKMKSNGDLSLRELIIDSPRWQLQPIITGSDFLYYDSNQQDITGVIVLTILNSRKTKN